MKYKYFTVKEVSLNNHCPECYSTEGLALTFKQQFVENSFYRAISNNISHSMVCTMCKTEIFPVSWSDNLESVYKYQEKAFIPRSATFKLKQMSWVLLTVLILLVIILNIYLFNS